MRSLGGHGLDGGQIHLWTVRLEASEDAFAQASSCLSPDEKDRAARFHFDRHRRVFVLGRAALRRLLANYLSSQSEMTPGEIRFEYGAKGKPALADATRGLRFNASNSGAFAAYAFTMGCEIGVDIEQHRPMTDMEAIARRFFSPDEAAQLLELPGPDRTAAFFRCWTRKEAYIKAVGEGLSLPLHSFQVTLRPSEAARMVSLGGSADAAKGWTLFDFIPEPDYAGAVAYPGPQRPILANHVEWVDIWDSAASTNPP